MIEGDSPSSEAGRTDRDHTQLVKQAAAELGFERCGIARAGPIPREAALLDWLARGRAGSMAYMHRHPGSRRDVREWLPWARSVIVVALNYHRPAPKKPNDQPRGRVAMYAWGEDYHVVLREKLDRLVERLEDVLDGPFQTRVCVDTSAIVERELAAMAGIGWIGKNTLVLHPSLGSFFFLGEIITDLSLEPDAPEPDHCGSCTRCLDACPTGAFPRAYEMDASRCISYLT
ncbi:MAG: tRNA epoxyqueuosine(34) reductase QueG, partial [Phycisphaerae bacterium]